MHGTGDIHDKEILPGWDLFGTNPFGGLYHGQEEVFLLTLIEQQACLDLIPSETVLQDKITVPALFF